MGAKDLHFAELARKYLPENVAECSLSNEADWHTRSKCTYPTWLHLRANVQPWFTVFRGRGTTMKRKRKRFARGISLKLLLVEKTESDNRKLVSIFLDSRNVPQIHKCIKQSFGW